MKAQLKQVNLSPKEELRLDELEREMVAHWNKPIERVQAMAVYADQLIEYKHPLGAYFSAVLQNEIGVIESWRTQLLTPMMEDCPLSSEWMARFNLDDTQVKNTFKLGDRIAPCMQLNWNNGLVQSVVFEIHSKESGAYSLVKRLYQHLLQNRLLRLTPHIFFGLVSLNHDVEKPLSVRLHDDPIPWIKRFGLPPYVQSVSLDYVSMISHAGDVDSICLSALSPIADKLKNLRSLEISGTSSLGTMDMPALERLEIFSEVSAKNLSELSKAQLPKLKRLELHNGSNAPVELREPMWNRLLRAGNLPKLTHLKCMQLDLDDWECDDARDEWESEHEDWSETKRERELALINTPFAQLLAQSPLLKQLTHLECGFNDIEREAGALIVHARSFAHLEEFSVNGSSKLHKPSKEDIRQAIGGLDYSFGVKEDELPGDNSKDNDVQGDGSLKLASKAP